MYKLKAVLSTERTAVLTAAVPLVQELIDFGYSRIEDEQCKGFCEALWLCKHVLLKKAQREKKCMRDAAHAMLQAIMKLVHNKTHWRLLCEQLLHKNTTKGEHRVLLTMLGKLEAVVEAPARELGAAVVAPARGLAAAVVAPAREQEQQLACSTSV